MFFTLIGSRHACPRFIALSTCKAKIIKPARRPHRLHRCTVPVFFALCTGNSAQAPSISQDFAAFEHFSYEKMLGKSRWGSGGQQVSIPSVMLFIWEVHDLVGYHGKSNFIGGCRFDIDISIDQYTAYIIGNIVGCIVLTFGRAITAIGRPIVLSGRFEKGCATIWQQLFDTD